MKKENQENQLISSWKIIIGILLFIVGEELLMELIIFDWLEPILLNNLEEEVADTITEIAEYTLLALLLIPITLYFIVVPVNRANQKFFQLYQKTRKTLEHEQQQNDLLTLIGRMAKVGGWEVDLSSMNPTWSEEVYRIHGVNPGKQLTFEETINFYDPEARSLISEAFEKCVSEGISYDLELPLIGENDKKLWVRMLGKAEQKNGKSIRVYGVLQDITEQVVSKLEAQKANLAKSQFLANMSHEIRTPMSGVMGTTQLLAKTDLDSKQKKYVELLLKSGQQLTYVINDILDYSKLSANKLDLIEQPFNLQECLQDIVDVMKGIAEEKNIALQLITGANIPSYVLGDSIRIKQVIGNLLSNAIKFTDVGKVTISVKTLSQNSSTVDLLFTVKDTGIGIKSEELPLLFKKFSQLDSTITRSSQGTGLGLVIANALVKKMGGEISVESQFGVGSEFYFTLHLTEITAEQVSSDQDSSEVDNETKGFVSTRILLVEDNPIIQFVTMDMLRDLGCKHDLASNGKEALNWLEDHEYDLVLMDIHMPEMDGLTATKHILQKYPEPPVIIALTADAMNHKKDQYLKAGMNDYLSKPINLNELQVIIKKYQKSET